ncbi:tyrosine-type recombinase/integrase [Fundidesulfovibrio butyratiphilus]
MPTLDKRSTPRWKGVVTINGQRKEKRFKDDSKKSYRDAVDWENQQRKVSEKNRTTTVSVSPTCLDWMNNYLDHSKDVQSSKTFAEKLSTAKRFIKHVGGQTLVEDFDLPTVMEFLRIQNKKRSGYAANRDRKNLAAGWNWGRKYLKGFPKTDNVFMEVERFPEKRSPRYVPSEDDFWKVFNLTSGQDKVMLLTFLHLAARKSEVFRLKVDDVDFGNQAITIWTRKREGGNTECDKVPMTDTLSKVLKLWLAERPVQSEYVFVNLGEEQFCKKFFGQPFVNRQHFLEKLCEKAGVKTFSYHAIRHLSASILYHEGQPVSVIQAILRHKSPTTTTRYLHGLGLNQTREALSSVMDGRGGKKVALAS